MIRRRIHSGEKADCQPAASGSLPNERVFNHRGLSIQLETSGANTGAGAVLPKHDHATGHERISQVCAELPAEDTRNINVVLENATPLTSLGYRAIRRCPIYVGKTLRKLSSWSQARENADIFELAALRLERGRDSISRPNYVQH